MPSSCGQPKMPGVFTEPGAPRAWPGRPPASLSDGLREDQNGSSGTPRQRSRSVTTRCSLLVKELGQMFIAGPPVVAQVGPEPTREELGGSRSHVRNGAVDDEVESEKKTFREDAAVPVVPPELRLAGTIRHGARVLASLPGHGSLMLHPRAQGLRRGGRRALQRLPGPVPFSPGLRVTGARSPSRGAWTPPTSPGSKPPTIPTSCSSRSRSA